MNIAIDPEFTIYGLLQRAQGESPVLRDRPTMTRISYTIEDATRKNQAYNRIFAGFQRYSRVVPQLHRYREIARYAESIYIFGVPDVDLPAIENVLYVPLSKTDRLAHEWFVISSGADFSSALCSTERSHIDDPDNQRRFEGLWTFDTAMVEILQKWLSSTVDALPLNPEILN